MSELTIRGVTATDLGDWERLWRSYLEFYRAEVPAETMRRTWQRLLDPAEPIHGALAIAESGPVGLVHYIEHRSCWTVEDSMYLQDLFVDSSVRGQGAGRALIEHVYAESAARGCSKVYWLTHETNETAMQLYDRIAERTGFLQYRKLL